MQNMASDLPAAVRLAHRQPASYLSWLSADLLEQVLLQRYLALPDLRHWSQAGAFSDFAPADTYARIKLNQHAEPCFPNMVGPGAITNISNLLTNQKSDCYDGRFMADWTCSADGQLIVTDTPARGHHYLVNPDPYHHKTPARFPEVRTCVLKCSDPRYPGSIYQLSDGSCYSFEKEVDQSGKYAAAYNADLQRLQIINLSAALTRTYPCTTRNFTLGQQTLVLYSNIATVTTLLIYDLNLLWAAPATVQLADPDVCRQYGGCVTTRQVPQYVGYFISPEWFMIDQGPGAGRLWRWLPTGE